LCCGFYALPPPVFGFSVGFFAFFALTVAALGFPMLLLFAQHTANVPAIGMSPETAAA
jgi:hypothetical protein